jgi:hypothetical protein
MYGRMASDRAALCVIVAEVAEGVRRAGGDILAGAEGSVRLKRGGLFYRMGVPPNLRLGFQESMDLLQLSQRPLRLSNINVVSGRRNPPGGSCNGLA